jgi:hypothetical protein
MKILIVLLVVFVALILIGGLCLVAAIMNANPEDIDPDYHP